MLDSNGGIAPCAIQTSSIDELNAFAADNGYSMGSHDAGEYRQYAVRSWNADDQLSVYTDKEGAIAYIEKTADVADASAAMAYARQYVSMTDPVELHTTVNGVDAATIIATCTIGDEEGIARCVYAGSTPEKIEVMTFRYAKVSGTASKLIGQPAKECTDAHALADAMVNYLIDNGGYVVRG